jgi:hypothetical protein
VVAAALIVVPGAAKNAADLLAARSPALRELEEVLVNCDMMNTLKMQKVTPYIEFNRKFNECVNALLVPHPDYETDIERRKARLLVHEVSLTNYYNCVREFMIYAALYHRAFWIFFGATARSMLGGLNHAGYQDYYNTNIGGSTTDATRIAQLETIRTNANNWHIHYVRPTIKLISNIARTFQLILREFPTMTVNNDLIMYMLTHVPIQMDGVCSIGRGLNGLDRPAYQTFDVDTRQFSLGTALHNSENSEEAAVASSVDDVASGPKASVLSKAPAKRGKKIRFELDDEQCATIADEAGARQ